MTVEELKEFIANNTEREIYNKFLVGQDVWYFREFIKDDNPFLYYDNFKRLIAANLGVHFNNISIIGSAKTRYSFAPKKGFREFNENSDFDIVLVSPELFNDFWTSFYDISGQQLLANYSGITSDIFRKFVSIKETAPNYNNTTLKNWQTRITRFRTILQLEYKIYSEINFRIYANWAAMENYHLRGIAKLKKTLNEAN